MSTMTTQLAVAGLLLWLAGCASAPSASGTVRAPASVPPMAVQAPSAAVQPVIEATVAPGDQRQAAIAMAARVLGSPTPQQRNFQGGRAAPGFDRGQYLADPAWYLDHADGSRAHAPAQPAADVPMLEPVGGTSFHVAQRGSCQLAAKTEPGMPVTFFSYGLGQFASGYTAISVAADASGIARATFVAVDGTVGSCAISAASPVRGGVLHYLVTIDD